MDINDGEDKHVVMERFCFSMIFWSSKYLPKNDGSISASFFTKNKDVPATLKIVPTKHMDTYAQN
jgi:hypothetical protein